jgi:hypothetical protein
MPPPNGAINEYDSRVLNSFADGNAEANDALS